KAPASQATTEEAKEKESAVVSVKVAPLKRKAIGVTVSAYGTITAAPERVLVLSAQFDGVVDKLKVTVGQQVNKGDVLAEVVPAPEMVLAIKEARETAEAAEKDLKLAQQRYDLKLATAQELAAAQSALRSARLKLESLQQRGLGERAIIRAPQ